MKRKVLLTGLAILTGLFLLSAPGVMAQEPCNGNFDCDQDVDADDVTEFLNHFGRSQYNNPCPTCHDSPCPCSPCPAGLIDCGGGCIDPLKDREYCGAGEGCLNGTTCGDGEICNSGVCEINCPPALMECNGVCVDTDNDEGNCGSCGNPCQADEMCVVGICETRLLTYAPVPKTGQTISYAVGDDGALQEGVGWPYPRFTDNGDGTITDNLTGLIWLKDANCFGVRDWYQALSDCNGLASGSCGLTDGSSAGDWRLPNRNELNSIIDVQYDYIALCNTAGTGRWTSGDPFTNVQSYFYWLSTTSAYDIHHAWILNMGYGDVFNIVNKNDSYYVWPVRYGHTTLKTIPSPVPKSWMTISYRTGDDGYYQTGLGWETPRFTDNSDGTVDDNFTGLMWIQNIGQFGRITWEAAVDTCHNLEYAGYQNWRLPNVKELFSLTDYSQFAPRIPAGHPFIGYEGGHDWCWSSTTSSNSSVHAQVFSPGAGDVGAENKTTKLFKCWCVRGGQ